LFFSVECGVLFLLLVFGSCFGVCFGVGLWAVVGLFGAKSVDSKLFSVE
jgi:hypothetical protein